MKLKNDLIFKMIGIFLFIYLVVMLGRTTYLNYNSSKQVKNLKSEIEALKEQNKKLADELEYLKSPAYIEKVARQRLGLKKPGEEVMVVVPDESGERVENKPEKPNYLKWWDYILGRS
ncbi:MAG: septum formation initiator family protein [Patescibacteria group bacterium]|nr:septum formation initiator family protein [Patescibacteria group bacterium]